MLFKGNQKSKASQEFQDLLLEHLESMYHLALRLSKNETKAEDLVQEATLKALRNSGQFEMGTNFKAWILKIVYNTFINQYRKDKREYLTDNIEGVAESRSWVGKADYPEELFSENLQKALNGLSEDYRTIIHLFYVERLSTKEISKVLKIPKGTVLSKLYLARQRLKQSLIQYKESG